MKERTKNTIRKMAAISNPICTNKCPGEAIKSGEKVDATRCCHKAFCDAANWFMQKTNVKNMPITIDKDLPYMGNKGCVLPPEHRPICSTYVCPGILKNDRQLRKPWQRLKAKLDSDLEYSILAGQMGNMIRRRFKK